MKKKVLAPLYLFFLSMFVYFLNANQVGIEYFKDGVLHVYHFDTQEKTTVGDLKNMISVEINNPVEDLLFLGESEVFSKLDKDQLGKCVRLLTLVVRAHEIKN